jgi:hypothetical protein
MNRSLLLLVRVLVPAGLFACSAHVEDSSVHNQRLMMMTMDNGATSDDGGTPFEDAGSPTDDANAPPKSGGPSPSCPYSLSQSQVSIMGFYFDGSSDVKDATNQYYVPPPDPTATIVCQDNFSMVGSQVAAPQGFPTSSWCTVPSSFTQQMDPGTDTVGDSLTATVDGGGCAVLQDAYGNLSGVVAINFNNAFVAQAQVPNYDHALHIMGLGTLYSGAKGSDTVTRGTPVAYRRSRSRYNNGCTVGLASMDAHWTFTVPEAKAACNVAMGLIGLGGVSICGYGINAYGVRGWAYWGGYDDNHVLTAPAGGTTICGQERGGTSTAAWLPGSAYAVTGVVAVGMGLSSSVMGWKGVCTNYLNMDEVTCRETYNPGPTNWLSIDQSGRTGLGLTDATASDVGPME